jgi:predicted homoserine dehydrogenase-like protein
MPCACAFEKPQASREGPGHVNQDKVRIAIVGGGRTGTPLIEQFLQTPYTDLVGVADVDAESPGAKLARDNGVFFTTDAMLFASKGDEIDLLIEVSGDATLKRRLKDAFIQEGNRHTIIMHDLVARLVMSLVSDSDVLVPSLHPDDEGIG